VPFSSQAGLAILYGVTKVLVVDDNEDSARTLGCLVESMGHDVEIAFDGPSAMDLVRDRVPDLILLDVGLPGMSGLELYDRLHRDERLRSVPVMFETAVSSENRAEFRKRGIRNVLQKPFDLNELIANVRELAPPVAA